MEKCFLWNFCGFNALGLSKERIKLKKEKFFIALFIFSF